MKKSLMVVTILAAVIVFAGCAPMVYVNPRQLSADDIVTMTNQNVGKDVIKQYITSTRSVFKLTTDEIVKLTQAKVDPDVIKMMLKTENTYSSDEGNSPYRSWSYSSWGYPYSYSGWYGYPYYYSYPNYYGYYRPYGYYGSGYRNYGYGGYHGGSGYHRGGDNGGVHQRSGGGQRGGGQRR